MWLTPPHPRFNLVIQSSSTLVVKSFFPLMETECTISMKASFWYTVATSPLLCWDQWNLKHCFSISGESCCEAVEMCKEWPCGSKEWNGCFVKQQVLSDKSYWSPKSDFSLVLLLNVWMWVTEEMPSSITQLRVKVQFLFCLPYKQDEVFPLHGVISLKHYILLGKGLLFSFYSFSKHFTSGPSGIR